MIRTFQSNERVEAIEFKDFSTIQPIISFTGMSVNVAFAPDGALRSVTLERDKTKIVAIPGQFIYKNDTDTVGVCNYEYLAEKYKEVTGAEK